MCSNGNPPAHGSLRKAVVTKDVCADEGRSDFGADGRDHSDVDCGTKHSADYFRSDPAPTFDPPLPASRHQQSPRFRIAILLYFRSSWRIFRRSSVDDFELAASCALQTERREVALRPRETH